VGLGLAQFHHLAFEKIQRGSLAGFEIGKRAGNCVLAVMATVESELKIA